MIIFAVMDQDLNPSGLNRQQLEIIIYFGLFVFTSLVGIIVWLAKKLDKKTEDMSQGQVTMGKDIEVMKNMLSSMTANLNEIPNIKLQLSKQSQLLDQNIKDFNEIKLIINTHEKAIQELKLLMARYLKVNFYNERDKE